MVFIVLIFNPVFCWICYNIFQDSVFLNQKWHETSFFRLFVFIAELTNLQPADTIFVYFK